MREHGWTLIELLVAMVLLTIAFAMVGRGVLNAFNGATGARTGGISDAAVNRASDAFLADVSRAETEDRAYDRARDPIEFAAAVRTGSKVASTDPGHPDTDLDIDDIKAATASKLTVQADVRPDSPGVECVTWSVATDAATVKLTRAVDRCSGGSLEAPRTMLSAPATLQTIETKPFSYQLQCADPACSGGGAVCDSPLTSSVSGTTKLRWIVAVRAHFVAGSTEGHSTSSSSASTLATIRSRDTLQYKEALGC